MRLRGLSFHSVKGGVGKSTLAVMAAWQCAIKHPMRFVYLIDMDLTGTSLADVLPLRCPRWRGNPPVTARLLAAGAPDDDFHDEAKSRERIAARHLATSTKGGGAPDDLHAPFLNDFLLHEPEDGQRHDPDLATVAWQVDPNYPRLFVIPSSAAPGDLDRIVPVIFDEQHAALLEARLERLLANLVSRHSDSEGITVVLDAPPTVPGLSRSVISLGLRLSATPREALAERGIVVESLTRADIDWTVHMVTTPDPQDLCATERWMSLLLPEEHARFRLVVNRHLWSSAPEVCEAELAKQLGLISSHDAPPAPGNSLQDAPPDPSATLGGLDAFRHSAIFVQRQSTFEFFLRRELPRVELDFGPLV